MLARLLDLPFHDSDAEIERRTGVDIPFIFEKEGEAGFRQREREAIEALTALEGIVLATGGGAVLLPENRAAISPSAAGSCTCRPRSRSRRTACGTVATGRCSHKAIDAAARLEQLMDARAPLYREIADITVSTDGRRVHSVAEHILRELERGASLTAARAAAGRACTYTRARRRRSHAGAA